MPRVTRKTSVGCHQCSTCGYHTDRKSSIDAHNNRKKPCSPQPFVRMVTAPDGTQRPLHSEHQCQNCDKVLSCKKSLKRHRETCKTKKHDEWALQNQKDEVWRNIDTKKPLVEGKFRCIRCHRDFASRQALHMHTKRVCPSVKNLVRVIDQRIEERGGESTPTPFRKFGFETVQHITDNMWMRWCRRFMLGTRAGGAINLMDMIWFNPTQPQNHNVRYTNKKLRFAEVWTGERWSLEDKNWVADQILDRIANDFDCYLHNNKVRLQSMTGTLAFHSNIIKGVKELVEIVLLNKNPREKRRMRTRMISKLHDFSKKNTLWASKTPFDKETMMKHQAALECARKADAEDTCYSMNREMERIKTETKKEIEQEVQKRVAEALLQMGLTEEQIEALRKRPRTDGRAIPETATPATTPATTSGPEAAEVA